MDTQLKQDDAVVLVNGRRTAVTLTSACMLAAYAVIGSSFGPLLAPTASYLRVSLVLAGLFPVAWSLCYIPGTVVSGALLDRYGARPVLAGAGGLVLCCFLLLVLGFTFPQQAPLWLLLVLVGVAGFGGGGIDTGANGLASMLYPRERAGMLILFNMVFPVGSTLVTLIDAALLWFFPGEPRMLLLFPTGLTAFSLVAFCAASRELLSPGQEVKRRPQTRSLRAFQVLCWRLAPMIGILLLAQGVGACLATWTPVYLQQTFSLSSAQATLLAGLILSSTIIYNLCMARYVSRFKVEWVMLFCLLLIFGGTLLLFMSNLLLDIAALVLIMLGVGSIVALCLAMGVERAANEPGLVSGVLLSCLGVGGGIWNWLFAVVFNEVGQVWAIALCVVGAGLGVLIGLALVFSRRRLPSGSQAMQS